MELKRAVELIARAKRILLIKTNLLGDVLNFLPVANFLRKFSPGARISWLVTGRGYPLVSEFSEVDEILLLNERLLYNYGNLWRVGRWLREKQFDVLVTSYQEECFLIGSLALLSRAPVRIGYNLRNRGWFFNMVVSKGEAERRIEIYGQIVNLLGGKWQDYVYVPRASERGAEDFAKRMEMEFGLKRNDSFCVLHLFSQKATRSWRWEYGDELIRGIQKELGLIPVLVGSEPEVWRWGEARKKHGLINLTGQLSLLELYYLLSRAKLFIGIDSFPLQLMEFSRGKAIALFGSTDPREAQVSSAEILRVDVECAPCWPRLICEQDYKCWRLLTPERILETAKRILTGVGA